MSSNLINTASANPTPVQYDTVKSVAAAVRGLIRDKEYKRLHDDDFVLDRLQAALDWVLMQSQPFEVIYQIIGDTTTEFWQLPVDVTAIRGVYAPGEANTAFTSVFTLESLAEIPRADFDTYQRIKALPFVTFTGQLYTLQPPSFIYIYPVEAQTYFVRTAGGQTIGWTDSLFIPRMLKRAVEYKAASDLCLAGYQDMGQAHNIAEIYKLSADETIQKFNNMTFGNIDEPRIRMPGKVNPYF